MLQWKEQNRNGQKSKHQNEHKDVKDDKSFHIARLEKGTNQKNASDKVKLASNWSP